MTKNEKLLTVTDENEEKLRALVEKAKTRVPELFQQHYKTTPEEFEKKAMEELKKAKQHIEKLIQDNTQEWVYSPLGTET
mgnify:FL=1